ncbi:hypothetical protein PR202_ga03112 [Eleusine coracana subsp. coracana]|uniref:N-acetyltransferase domain-containing protein n=1 Tax=Eleusine coracana subsp. coracana TaxID=191504 RepID=A0AAV5BN88_ELECO|nr:hypothetical protein PR202_ga03112 [Eleusine coracana subsp. coracana]
MMSPALSLSRSPSSSVSSSPLDRCRRSAAAVWRHHGPSFAYKPAAGICYASQAVELLPSLLGPEIVVRDARLEDCWEVADTHFNSNSVNNSFNIECGDPRDAGFQKYNLSRGSIAGILTVDTVADYLPRRGPLKQRRTGIAYIANVAVRKEQRRKGIAKMLVQEAEARAQSWGCRTMALHCDVNNLAALRLYKNQGFKCIRVPEGAKWPEPKIAKGMQYNFMMKLVPNI